MPMPDAPDKELVVLQTEPGPARGLEVAPAHTLRPVTLQEVLLQFRVEIHNALSQACFFRADVYTLRAAVEAELREILPIDALPEYSTHVNGDDPVSVP